MEENKKSKKGIIIAILVLIIIVLAGVGGYFGYQLWKDSQTTGTDWGDTYLENLEGKISNGDYGDADDASLGFIQFEESNKPAMVLNYETGTNKIMEISVLDSENNIKYKKYETEKENELDIEMLYDIESKEYNWYEHEKKQDGTEIFTEVAQNDIEQGTEPTEDKKHQFTKEEMTEQEVPEGEIPSIPKFDEEFVKPDIELNETDIDLKNKDIDKKDIKDKVEEAIEDYKPQKNITDEAKQNVDNSLKNLETKKEEIKKAEEEKAKKEAEEKAKAEEEARKKAEEEAAKGLKVGSLTLKYGTYSFNMPNGGENGKTLTSNITLKPNGVFHITANFNEDDDSIVSSKSMDCDGTYRVELNQPTGYPDEYADFLRFTTNTGENFVFIVGSSTGFGDQWHDYSYSGN